MISIALSNIILEDTLWLRFLLSLQSHDLIIKSIFLAVIDHEIYCFYLVVWFSLLVKIPVGLYRYTHVCISHVGGRPLAKEWWTRTSTRIERRVAACVRVYTQKNNEYSFVRN